MIRGLFLLSGAGLVFQLALTRLSSAALEYHLTFFVIGAAMAGAAGGGTWVAVRPPALAGQAARRLARLSLLAAAAMALVAALFAFLPLGSLGALSLPVVLLLAYPLVALPAGLIGAAAGTALQASPERAAVLYAADLAGAGAGCAAALALMQLAGPPGALGAAVAGCAAAGAVFDGRQPAPPATPRAPDAAPGRLAGWDLAGWDLAGWGLAGGSVLLSLAAAAWLRAPNVLPGKPLATLVDQRRHPGATLRDSTWDAFSRVDTVESPGAALLWQVGNGADPAATPTLAMTIDGDALTAVLGGPAGALPATAVRELVRHLPTSLPYEVAPRQRTLVIGPGGGADVAAARAYGSGQVDAVEVNPGVVRLMLGPLRAASGDPYRQPGVSLVVDEGRSFVHRSPARYDAIVLTAVDSWAALAAGSYTLSESYLYTQEAMADYVAHLAPGGVLAISRWYTAPPREMQRLARMAARTLAERDAAGSADSAGTGALLLLRAQDFGTLLVRRGPFTAPEVERAAAFAAGNGFQLALRPGEPLERLAAGDPPAGGPAPEMDASDDRPYFFDFAPWGTIFDRRLWPAGPPRGHAVLLASLVQALCCGVAAVLLPLRRLRRSRAAPGLTWGLGGYGYFGAIGVGFMLVELTLAQRLTLLIGHPLPGLAVTVGGLLAGAAAGSWLASAPLGRAPAWLGPAACALLLLGEAAAGPVQARGLGWALPWRVALGLLLVLPPAAAMGLCLPAGLRRLATDRPAVAWAWGINGAASAVGATLAIMLAMAYGQSAVLILAAALYCLAGALLLRLRQPPREGHRSRAPRSGDLSERPGAA